MEQTGVKQEMVSSIEVVKACLKTSERGGEPSPFEVALVTEAEKNRDILYNELQSVFDKINAVLNPGVAKEMGILKKAFQNDPEYAWAWHCNIAMASVDEGMEKSAANRAAARFMTTCFGVDMTKHEHYPDTQLDDSAVDPEKRYLLNMHLVKQDKNLEKNIFLLEVVEDKELTESECGTLSSVFGIPKHYFEVIKNGVD